MEYLSQAELKKMLLLSYEKVEKNKEQINKINVFPVPDQDTGSNLAKTLSGIKEAIDKKDLKDLKEVSEAALDGALTTAQGNAGVIYVGFLASFLSLLDKNPVDAKKLALAFEKGAERARMSIQNPKEGTILDVIDATAQSFKEESQRENDIAKILRKAIGKANEALLATREKMEIFRKANVVDAGGLGFLMILESYSDALGGEKRKEKKAEEKPSEKIKRFVQVLANRYEVVSLIENSRFDEKTFQEKLKKLGNSLDIVQIGNKTKIHIHTDYPDEVKDIIRGAGETQELRVEDMAKEVIGEESVRKVSIGIVTEDVTALLPKISEKYQIEIVRPILDWPEAEKTPGANIYQKMRQIDKLGIKTFPKTSQASPKAYLSVIKKQLSRFDKVLCITVSSGISGCYNSAKQAAAMTEDPQKVFVVDSRNAAAGQALLILKAIELIQEQTGINEVVKELNNLIPKIFFYVIFEDPKWLESIGRMTNGQANWVRRMKKLNLQPLMTIKNGVVQKGGIIFAKDVAEAVFKKIAKESKKVRLQGKRIRVVINQADNLEEAEKLKKLLKKEIGAEVSFISEAPALLGAVAGPGTLISAWMPL